MNLLHSFITQRLVKRRIVRTAKTKHFPYDFSDEEIRKRIDDNVHTALQLNLTVGSTDYFTRTLQMAQLGQSELNLRSQKRFGKSSKILSYVSIVLAICTIVLAGFTIRFSQRDLDSDETWRSEQLQVLQKSNELIMEHIHIYKEVNAKLDVGLIDEPSTNSLHNDK